MIALFIGTIRIIGSDRTVGKLRPGPALDCSLAHSTEPEGFGKEQGPICRQMRLRCVHRKGSTFETDFRRETDFPMMKAAMKARHAIDRLRREAG